MTDLFTGFTAPPPPERLRARAIAAAGTARRDAVPMRALDVLSASRTWWLGWSAAMVTLALAGAASSENSAVPEGSWESYRAGITRALEGEELATNLLSPGNPGGGA